MFDSRRLVLPILAVAAVMVTGWVVLRGRCGGGSSTRPSEEIVDDESADGGGSAEPTEWPIEDADGRPRGRDAGRTADRAPGALPEPTASDGSGTILGLVLDTEAIPLPGAAVVVRREAGRTGGWARFGPAERPDAGLAAGRADFDGFFRIEGVPVGRFVVEAAAAGFASETHRDVEVQPQGETWIEFRLQVGLSISGRVTDEHGDPVGGAELSASGPGTRGAWATSAPDGSYEISGLRAGTWFVRVSASGYVDDVQPGVRAGATGVDFRLGRAGGISGRVVWRGTGSPIVGASVRAESHGMRGPGIGAGPFARGLRTTTAADGTFLLADLAPGSWIVHADATGRAPEASRELTVPAGQRLEGVVLELGGGARLSGRVVAEGTGRPVEGAVVSIVGGGGPPGGGMGRRGGPPWMRGGAAEEGTPDGETSTRTDGAGRFLLEHVASGRRTLVASHAVHPQARVVVNAPETGEKGGIEITLPSGGSITGTVRDVRGNLPAGYSTVVAMASGAGRGSGPPGSGMMDTGSADIEATGRYRIDGLRPGEYRVSAMRGMDAPEGDGAGRPVMSPPVEATVRSGETSEVDIVLGGGTSVFGKVLQAGEPLPGAQVAFFPEGGAFGGFASTVADDEGSYRVDGLQPGAYAVRVEMSPVRVEVPDVEEFPLDLTVPEGGIAGRVVVATTGEPVPDVRVVVLRADASAAPGGRMHGFAGTARTGADGSFEISGLSQGAYTVQVSSEAWSPGTKPVDLSAGGRIGDLVLVVEPGLRIVGTVVDGEGNAVPGAMVTPSDPVTGEPVRGGSFHGRISGADGSFEISGLSPGRYEVRAVARDFAPSEPHVVEAGDGSSPIVIRLTAAAPSGTGTDFPIRPGGDLPVDRPRMPP